MLLFPKIDIVVYLSLFVHDLLNGCRDIRVIDYFKSKFSDIFEMKDLGKVKNYIGINIDYNYDPDNILTLSQEHYIVSLTKCYNIENAKLNQTPMEIKFEIGKFWIKWRC